MKVRPWSLPPKKTLGLIGRKTYEEVLSTQYSEGSRRGEPRGLWGQKKGTCFPGEGKAPELRVDKG